MKLLHSVPASNSSMTFYIPKGQYGSLMIRYELDAAAGVTLTRANLGNVILNWNGQDVVNCDAEILNQLDNVYGGVSEFSASAGSTHNASVFIPCGLWFDSQNVYDIGENDNVYLKLDFSDLASAANVDSGTINVYGKNKTGVMSYLHNITSRPVVASGASTLADTYKINNISQIYLKDPATLLSNVQFSKDKETIVDASPGVLISYSDYIHQLETTNTTLAVDFTESGDVREAVGTDISYKFTFSGAGTQYMYFSFLDFTPAKAVQSRMVAERKILPVVEFMEKDLKSSSNATSVKKKLKNAV
jgi:hypothetical protein